MLRWQPLLWQPAEATAAAATSTRLLEKISRLVCQLPARDAKLGNPEKESSRFCRLCQVSRSSRVASTRLIVATRFEEEISK
jgi:hypothetical protein